MNHCNVVSIPTLVLHSVTFSFNMKLTKNWSYDSKNNLFYISSCNTVTDSCSCIQQLQAIKAKNISYEPLQCRQHPHISIAQCHL